MLGVDARITLTGLAVVIDYANAYETIDKRSDEAYAYCQKYHDSKSIILGKNIWHAILDDAIRMRKELEKC